MHDTDSLRVRQYIWYLLYTHDINSLEVSEYVHTLVPYIRLPWLTTVRPTTAMGDHLSWKTRYVWQKLLHVNLTEPVTTDHLFWEAIFYVQWGGHIHTYTLLVSQYVIWIPTTHPASIYMWLPTTHSAGRTPQTQSFCSLFQVFFSLPGRWAAQWLVGSLSMIHIQWLRETFHINTNDFPFYKIVT